jgi:hypothetical protein
MVERVKFGLVKGHQLWIGAGEMKMVLWQLGYEHFSKLRCDDNCEGFHGVLEVEMRWQTW